MERETKSVADGSWRVVLMTMIAGGVVYPIVADVLDRLGHRIVGVLTSAGPPRVRSTGYLDVVAVVPPGIDVLISDHPSRWAAMLGPLRPDLIICAGMPWRLPDDTLALPRLGAINVHAALLPRHRGPGAFEWALRSDDPEMGFTIHRMAADFDAGPILSQARVPIGDDDDAFSLLSAMLPTLPGALEKALVRVAAAEPGDPQDESRATYAGRFEDAWGVIDWSEPARAVHNRVRSWVAFSDTPFGALGVVDGEPLRIVKTRLLPTRTAERGQSPGTVVRRDDEGFLVQCGDGPLEIVEWRPEAG